MESIDDLLNQIKAEYSEKDNPKPQPKQPTLKAEDIFGESSTPINTQPSSWHKNITPSAAEYSLISELKAEFSQKEREEELRKQEELKQEQKRQEKIRQQQRQALTREAQEWLKKLNPRSEEGLWFEEFAYAYSSKLDAALDYLQALKETKAKS